jgi:hypothetical protein
MPGTGDCVSRGCSPCGGGSCSWCWWVWQCVLAVWSFLVQPPQQWLGWYHYEGVQTGIKRTEVEAIMGQPGDYRSGQTLIDLDLKYGLPPGWTGVGWVNDRWVFVVTFDDNGRVGSKFLRDNQLVPQSRIENLLWRTKRQWRKWFP